MAIIPRRHTLVVLGLLKQLVDGVLPAKEEDEDVDDFAVFDEPEPEETDGDLSLDSLAEDGEELLDRIQGSFRSKRKHIESELRGGLQKVFSNLGLVTRDDLKNLGRDMDKTSDDLEGEE